MERKLGSAGLSLECVGSYIGEVMPERWFLYRIRNGNQSGTNLSKFLSAHFSGYSMPAPRALPKSKLGIEYCEIAKQRDLQYSFSLHRVRYFYICLVFL